MSFTTQCCKNRIIHCVIRFFCRQRNTMFSASAVFFFTKTAKLLLNSAELTLAADKHIMFYIKLFISARLRHWQCLFHNFPNFMVHVSMKQNYS